jgi:hypothetical protein
VECQVDFLEKVRQAVQRVQAELPHSCQVIDAA